MRSGKKVDNQVSMPLNPIQHTNTQASFLSCFNPSQYDESEKEKLVDQVHKPIVPFPYRLKTNKQNAHVEKIIEISNKVKINVPLLDAIQ